MVAPRALRSESPSHRTPSILPLSLLLILTYQRTASSFSPLAKSAIFARLSSTTQDTPSTTLLRDKNIFSGRPNTNRALTTLCASSLRGALDDDINLKNANANISENPSIPGLMSDEAFSFRSAVHNTLRNLQDQLPQTLTVPLDPKVVEKTYTADCTIVGPKGEVLGSDRDEIVSLSNTIATALGTARRAARLATTLAKRSSSSSDKEGDRPGPDDDFDLDLIKCELTLDSSLSVLYVKWTATLPVAANPGLDSRPGRSRPQSELVGSSIFTLDNDGLISKHQVLHVELDGRSIDAVGETLASLRRTVKTVTERSPWVLEAAEAAAPLLADLAEIARGRGTSAYQSDEVGARGSENRKAENTTESSKAPIFVTDMPTSQRNNASTWEKNTRWELDSFSRNKTASMDGELSSSVPYPLPGGNKWEDYESAHRSLQSFARSIIPYLSGELDPVITPLPNGISFRDLFAPDVKLKGFDGSTLVEGSGRVSDLYRFASTLRVGGSITSESDDAWRVIDIKANWKDRTVQVRWLSNIQVKVEGTDVFHLNNEGGIQLIEQKELVVGSSKIIDASWQRAIVSAVESSRGGAGGEILGDVLKRISRGRAGTRPNNIVEAALKRNTSKAPPELDTSAAAAVYNIIRTLHAELPSIVDARPGSPSPTPAKIFLSKDIELRGMLDETLARGITAYSQALSASIGSLRAAIRSGSVKTMKDIVPIIEVTQLGTIRVSLEINLRIEPPTLPKLPVRSKMSDDKEKKRGRQASLLDIGIPLDLLLISEYVVDRSGRVIEHRICQNKINGQKSPADLVSNWIKEETRENDSSSESTIQAFIDAVKWASSISAN